MLITPDSLPEIVNIPRLYVEFLSKLFLELLIDNSLTIN